MNRRFAAPNSPAQKPKTAEELQHKSHRQQLKRDRAIIRHEVGTLRRAEATPVEREAAAKSITSRVVAPLNLKADAQGQQLLATLADALLDNGQVGLGGIQSAIEAVAVVKNIPKSDLDTLTPEIVERLDKLV